MNKIEQVKKILYQGYLTDIAAAGDGNLYIFGEEEVKSVALVKGK